MSISDFFPRHIKGYLWISFLVAIFCLMALSENGAFEKKDFILDPIPGPEILKPVHRVRPEEVRKETPAAAVVEDAQKQITTKPKPKPLAEEEAAAEETESTSGLNPKDVVIVVKTGASSIWRRMPMHMSTTLANPKLTPNILFYSDSPDNINGNPVIDSLANVSATLKASHDFTLYHKAKEISKDNLYLESGSMEGDLYLPGGWRLDKYKFLPMFQHVAAAMPGKKWYVYMEDDNYFFWESLYAWLATYDHTSATVIGSPAYRLGEDFAHGGSGFAISGAALKKTFGADKQLAEKWEEYAREQCCGDQVLSHVMTRMGVKRDKSLDGSAWSPLQSLPTFRISFGDWNWCSPLMNVHKVHQADISRLHVFEQEFKAKSKRNEVMRYRDLFNGMVKSNINIAQRSEWDNYAAAKTFSSSQDGAEALVALTTAELAKKPWMSSENCLQACKDWPQCFSWKYADDSCSLDHTAAMGQRIDAGIRMESGWMLDRIAKLDDKECEALKF